MPKVTRSEPGLTLTPEAAMQLDEVVRRIAQEYFNNLWGDDQVVRSTGNKWAKLKEDLDEASGESDSEEYSVAKANIWAIDANRRMYDTGVEVTVVNRFSRIPLDSGTLIGIEWQNGEWTPYKGNCPDDGSDSGSY